MAASDAKPPLSSSSGAVFEWGLARILGPDGEPRGAGFLLAPDLVCTCAHLLVGRPQADSVAPDVPLRVDFPLLADPSAPVATTVAEWRPADDILVLRLADEVPGTMPLPPAGLDAPPWGVEARVYGFPETTRSGVNAHGVLRGGEGRGRFQLDAGHGSVPLTGGFSGSPVWDVQARAVVGMLATRGRAGLEGTAYLVPERRLALQDAAVGSGPFKGLLRFEEEDSHLFHGRERETEDLAEAVRVRPLTLLTGQSGTGKSSLLRAGLLPRLRDVRAVVTVRTPREADAPAEFLGEALLALWDTAEGGASDDSRVSVVRQALSEGGIALAHLRERLRAAAGDRLCVLLLDQFEEYAAAPRAARQIVTWLRELTDVADTVPGRGLRVVLSARHATLDVLAPALPAAERRAALVYADPLSEAALAEIVSEPLRTTPGITLQPGLLQRLLRDAHEAQEAHGEANCLPLLEFTLAELWRHRTGGRLTTAAYEELGGLSGALAGHAQATLDHAVADGAADEIAARRLFQRLARPDGVGRFVPDDVPAAELDDSQTRLARRMVREKLLVWTRPHNAEESGESLRIAHEALLREWQWLGDCLREGAEFRAWQAEVEDHARRWRESGGRLLAAPPERLLGAAKRWLTERAADVTERQRAYLAAGRRRARMGTYGLMSFAAVTVVLAVLTALLAVDAVQRRDRAEERLRTLASQQLADLSEERASSDFEFSVQAAMGAWATQDTDKAEAALFRQYLRMRGVESVRTGLWQGRATAMESAPAGDALAVVIQSEDETRGQIRLITGATSDQPRGRTLQGIPKGDFQDAFSDDGRWYAVTAADGSVRLWEVGSDDTAGRLLSAAGPAYHAVFGPSLDFSDDGTRLLRLHAYDAEAGGTDQQARLDAWTVSTGRPIPMADRIRDRPAESATFVAGGDSVAVTWNGPDSKEPTWSAGVFALSDGQEKRRLVTDSSSIIRFTARGTLLETGVSNARPAFMTLDGTEQGTGFPLRFLDPDATGLYRTAFAEAGDPLEGVPEYGVLAVTAVRPDTAPRKTWTAIVPTDGTAEESVPVAVWPPRSDGGVPTMAAALGESLLLLNPVEGLPPGDLDFESGVNAVALAPAADRFAVLQENRLYVVGEGVPIRSAVPPGEPEGSEGWQLTWMDTDGYGQVALWDPGGRAISLHAADDPARRADIELPMPDGSHIEWVTQLGNGDLAVLLSSNEVLRVDPDTATILAPALRVAPAPQGAPSPFAPIGQIVPRPGHPAQALITTSMGSRTGEVTVWDLVEGKQVTRWDGSVGVRNPLFLTQEPPSVTFSADGSLAAVAHSDRKIRFWNVASGRKVGNTVPFPTGSKLVAFAGTTRLLVLDAGNTLALYDAPSGRAVGAGPSPAGGSGFGAVTLPDSTVRFVVSGQIQTLAIETDTWWRSLCRIADRPFNDREREELPPGSRPEPPCTAE
ncbi:trypsin-like peptidase domain-containing protein [Streptomyces sp. NPDC059477]|uniref:nSTAND1 domain-containing NTPase n=1 Tax=Streptomyces sp. NPDC059477 TaxID=3346847 RepID=UPI00367B92D1